MLKKKVLQYIQECSHSISKNQIARFLKVRGDNRISLKKILNDLIKESEIRKEKGNRYCLYTQLPKTLVTKVLIFMMMGKFFAHLSKKPRKANHLQFFWSQMIKKITRSRWEAKY